MKNNNSEYWIHIYSNMKGLVLEIGLKYFGVKYFNVGFNFGLKKYNGLVI